MSQPLPPLDPLTMPRAVRDGSAHDQQVYRAALGFERMLVGQLTKAMQSGLGATGDDGSGQDGGPYASLLPGALADGVMASGGLGLADQLWQSMRTTDATDATPQGGTLHER